MRRPVIWFLVGASAPLVAVVVAMFWFSRVERCVRDQERLLGVDNTVAHQLCAVLKH